MSDTYESALTLLKPEEVNYDPAQFGELCDGYLFGKFKNYRLKKKLGEGGMGQTWLAEELVENEVSQRVVLKILTQELRGNENALKEVRRIFDLTKNLNHSSICPLLGRYVDPNFGDFLVMKYADGGTLADWFKAQPGHENGLPLETLLPIFGPLAAALDLAHRNGILHRDVKPQNIMFMGKTPVLIDFGIAARIRPEDVTSHTQSFSRTDTMASSTSGTPRYMAPEQMEGSRQNARTDQYALATVLYEMLTGSLPFSGNVVAISRQKLLFKPQSLQFAPHVNAALTRALSFEPKDRFESCVEFLNALKAPPSFSKPTSQVQSKSNAPLWGIAAILAFVLLFCAVFFSRNSETLKETEPSLSSEVSLIEEQLRVSEAARLKAEADAEASRKAEAAALAKAEKEAQEKAEAEKRAKEAEKKAKKTAKSKPKTSEPDPPPEPPKPAVRKAGERMVKTVDGIEYAFRWCPAGTFTMGSPEDEPGRFDIETQHSVTLTRGFWMLETEVTQAMWESVMGTTLEEQAQKMLHD
ncbi:MAG: protein kinase, partial [Thermoguttaceae bacterium]|nr:protein kinase [Thermoguttaceae bacterium]